jgi:hypothetical protein
MSAIVKPEPVIETPRPVIDIDTMIDQQEMEIRKFYETVLTNERVKAMRPRWPMKDYLKRVIERHVDLLEKFGGWRYHSTPFGNMPMADAKITEVITAHINQWSKGAVLYAANRGKEAEKLAALQLKQWQSEAEAIFCTVHGCCFPAPNAKAVNLWRSRIYTPVDKMAKEGEELYAARTFIKIRSGQAVTRAVLAEVRKTFKDHPNYIKMWETLCEKVGVEWAASSGYPITLSFAPVDFLRCGHYGEANSCYRTGHQQEHSKYNLTMITNSVMGLFYNDPGKIVSPNELRGGVKPAARCWGILDLEHEGALFSNIYLLYFAQVQPSIEALLNQAFGWDVKGGLPSETAVRNFTQYAYTNGDNNVYASPKTLRAVQEGLNSQCVMTEGVKHTRVPCSSCQTAFGHVSMLHKCSCGLDVCEECSQKTECCGRVSCKKCVPKIEKCAGCHKTMCGRCVDKNGVLTMCRDSGLKYCPACAEKSLTKCSHCTNYTSRPAQCHIDKADKACPTCAKDKLRECNRCHETVGLKHITRCSGCKERRCDNCQRENEVNEPKALCSTCQEQGVEPKKAPEVDKELLERFRKSIDALPVEVRDKYLASMREYRWDLDEVLLDQR